MTRYQPSMLPCILYNLLSGHLTHFAVRSWLLSQSSLAEVLGSLVVLFHLCMLPCGHDHLSVLQAALLLAVWDSLKPKFDAEAFKRPKRPVQYNFDEEPNIDDVMDNIASVRKIGGRKF